jgi:hypothetical protein
MLTSSKSLLLASLLCFSISSFAAPLHTGWCASKSGDRVKNMTDYHAMQKSLEKSAKKCMNVDTAYGSALLNTAAQACGQVNEMALSQASRDKAKEMCVASYRCTQLTTGVSNSNPPVPDYKAGTCAANPPA